MRPLLAVALAALACACGPAIQPQPRPVTEEPARYQPCPLEAGTLELLVSEEFALAASAGACLLIDESQEATFISLAELRDDEEGSSLLREDLRAFLRSSALLGDSPRFTGREHAMVLGQDVEVHSFVATPPGLTTRAGFAMSAPVHGGAILIVGFGETPEAAATLRGKLSGARLRAAN